MSSNYNAYPNQRSAADAPSGQYFTAAVLPRETRAFPATLRQLFIFFLVFWNTQMFSSSVANPLGIKGVQEVLYIILLFFATFYLMHQAVSHAIKKTDLIVFVMVICPFMYSAAASYMRFSQPIIYGLIEERRILAFLIYFPLVWAFRTRVISVYQLFTWINWFAIICAILTVLVYLNIIHPLQSKDLAEGSLREDRYGIGVSYIAIATLFLVYRIPYSRIFTWAVLLVLYLGVLIVIVQTRQILISLAIALVIARIPLKRIRISMQKMLKLMILSGLFFLVAAWLMYETTILPGLLNKYEALFSQMASEQYISQSARAQTISSIMGELRRNEGAWLGSGSLSLMWHGGFDPIYGINFYLADVGIIGSLYKFGVFAVLLLLIYLTIQFRIMRSVRGHSFFRLFLAIWAMVLIMMPVGAPVEHRGYMAGLLLAISVGGAIEISSFVEASGRSTR